MTGDLLPLAAVSTGLKRRRGVEGNYLDETSVFPGVTVVLWKLGVSFVSPDD